MTYSQKYALVHFISPIEDGTQFHMSDWLLHTTLADVFAINRHETNIDKKLATLLAQVETVETTTMDDSILGTTQVILLDKTPPLMKLHTDIVSLLEENNATFNNPEFTRSGFLPHSTIQKSGRLHTGDKVIIDSISLVDMFPDNDWEQRRVLTTFKMKK
jgi:hypothetical protein